MPRVKSFWNHVVKKFRQVAHSVDPLIDDFSKIGIFEVRGSNRPNVKRVSKDFWGLFSHDWRTFTLGYIEYHWCTSLFNGKKDKWGKYFGQWWNQRPFKDFLCNGFQTGNKCLLLTHCNPQWKPKLTQVLDSVRKPSHWKTEPKHRNFLFRLKHQIFTENQEFW